MIVMQYSDNPSIPISYLRQYIFCARIPWYKAVMNFEPPEQQWVTQGKEWHSAQELLQKRRKVNLITEPYKRETNVFLSSTYLGLHGYADEIIFNDDQLLVIEYKIDKQRPVTSQKVQLAAYAMVAAEQFQCRSEYGVLLKGSSYKQYKINIDNELKLKVINTVRDIRTSFQSHLLPVSSAQYSQCEQCEYLRYCNDR